jgi:hypothetical protein
MPRRSGAECREVDAWIVAGGLLFACWIGVACARRRAARRRAEAKARARVRRERVPLVSANVLGQSMRKPDIWREEAEAASQGRPRDA